MKTTSSFEFRHKIHHKFDLNASHKRSNTDAKIQIQTHSRYQRQRSLWLESYHVILSRYPRVGSPISIGCFQLIYHF